MMIKKIKFNFKHIFLIFTFCTIFFLQNNYAQDNNYGWIKNALKTSEYQLTTAAQLFQDSMKCPRSIDEKGNVILVKPKDWTSGFFPGSLWIMYDLTGKETLKKEAEKYKTRQNFKKNSKAAYSAAINRNLIDELFKNHLNKGYVENIKPRYYWTYDKLQEEVNKYKTRGEFQKNSSAYKIAYKKKLLDDLFKNHVNNGYQNIEEWKENSYVIYSYELTEYKKVYVGLTNNIDRRDKEHLFNEKSLLYNFLKEKNIPYPEYKILEKDLKSIDAQKQEKYWVEYYKNLGWTMFNSAKPGSLGAGFLKWTIKALQKEADKYISRIEFRKNNSAYITAKKRKILDELFKNRSNQGYTRNKKNQQK